MDDDVFLGRADQWTKADSVSESYRLPSQLSQMPVVSSFCLSAKKCDCYFTSDTLKSTGCTIPFLREGKCSSICLWFLVIKKKNAHGFGCAYWRHICVRVHCYMLTEVGGHSVACSTMPHHAPFPFCLLKTGSLTEPGVYQAGWGARMLPLSSVSCTPVPGVAGTSRQSQALHGFWDFEHRSTSCSTSTLTHQPSPQPSIFITLWNF